MVNQHKQLNNVSDYESDYDDELEYTQAKMSKAQIADGKDDIAFHSKSYKHHDSETLALESKYMNRINLSHSARNYLEKSDISQQDRRIVDKSDRATVEQCLDPRTRLILFKMLNKNDLFEINGCVSTGKEANVYHAVTECGQQRAIKIYKTSILTFKDRDRYVTGEHRFKSGYSKHNPRKMVKVWAEKEFRNLKRLNSCGIPSPEPLVLKGHVLVMTFVGTQSGIAAPRLKDAQLDQPLATSLYWQVVKQMRKLFQQCRLVHADLSEYNLLVHEGVVYMIDVSQSVEHDHPNSLEFLRKDCVNVCEFFSKQGVEHMFSLRELFDFVTLSQLSLAGGIAPDGTDFDDLMELFIQQHIERRQSRSGLEGDDAESDQVFLKSYIPRTLGDIVNVEKEINKAKEQGVDALSYQNFCGIVLPKQNQQDLLAKVMGEDLVDASDSDSDSDTLYSSEYSCSDSEGEEEVDDDNCTRLDSESDTESGDDIKEKHFDDVSAPTAEQVKEARKLNKKVVKEAKREKRLIKMPKAVKKRKQKVSKGKKR
ncbi:hypothetical protein MP228_004865 [Amoeboaphelidium protococcarum]|nr:hypothetical protein MP228_004865 [Amoeboaphelidium protococcarum]